MTKCKLCYGEFKAVDVQSICDDCQEKMLNALGVKVNKGFRVADKDIPLANFVYLVGELAANVDYLFHAVENHTHGKKVVDTVDVQ